MSKWLPVAGLFIFIVSVAGAYSFGYGIARDRERLKSIDAVEAAKLETENVCILNNQTTRNASNVFQNGLTNRINDLDDVMRQQTCLSITESGTTSRPDAANQQSKSHHANEVNSNTLYKFSSECEIDRLKVIGLQQFIKDERQSK